MIPTIAKELAITTGAMYLYCRGVDRLNEEAPNLSFTTALGICCAMGFTCAVLAPIAAPIGAGVAVYDVLKWYRRRRATKAVEASLRQAANTFNLDTVENAHAS